jgi:hypothetical protein
METQDVDRVGQTGMAEILLSSLLYHTAGCPPELVTVCVRTEE